MKLTFLAHFKIIFLILVILSVVATIFPSGRIIHFTVMLAMLGLAICEGLEEIIRRIASFESMLNEVRKEIRKVPSETSRLSRS